MASATEQPLQVGSESEQVAAGDDSERTAWDELSDAEIDAAADVLPDAAIITESFGMLTAILAYDNKF
jgi:hypothetical protein